MLRNRVSVAAGYDECMLLRVGVLALVAGATLFAAANVQVGWLYALGALYVGLLGASLGLASWRLRSLWTVVRSGSTLEAGEALSVVVEIENRGAVGRGLVALVAPPLGEARIRPLLTVQRVPERWASAIVDRLDVRKPRQARLTIAAARRGVYPAPPLYLVAAPLGLFTCWRTLRLPTEIVVTPALVPLTALALEPLAGLGGDETAPVGSALHGEHIRSTREYRSGDPLRSVHWRGTARRGRLIVKETEGMGQVGAVIVALDLQESDAARLERAISVAASLVTHLHQEGRAVGLISQEGLAEGALASQLEALARARKSAQPLEPLLADRDPEGLLRVFDVVAALDRSSQA